jgi:hypothetical protein
LKNISCALVRGIAVSRIGAILIGYLVVYYLFNIFLVQHDLETGWCNHTRTADDINNNTFAFHLGFLDKEFKKLQTQEKDFNILNIFLLGFYVSFLMARWWQQVSGIPKLNSVCIQLHAHTMFNVSDRKNATNLGIEHEFKNKVARYCLLSWTMCLSDLSLKLRSKFKSKMEYINKGLITLKEYNQITQGTHEVTVEEFSSKWFIPLNWAALSINKVTMDTNNTLLKENKDLLREILRMQNKLERLTRFKSNPMPHTICQIIKIVVWVHLGCSIIVYQGTVVCGKQINGGSGVTIIAALLLNFPFLDIVKNLLILGWYEVANDVTDPFGFDRCYTFTSLFYDLIPTNFFKLFLIITLFIL